MYANNIKIVTYTVPIYYVHTRADITTVTLIMSASVIMFKLYISNILIQQK
jgi:hypothetical protein